MEATTSRNTQVVCKKDFHITLSLDKCLPFVIPDVIVDFPRSLPRDQSDQLTSIGYSQVTIKTAKNALIFHFPTVHTLQVPRQLKANPLVSPAQDTINLKAIGSFFLIKRIFSSSFCTHTYPAFLDNDHTIPYEDFPISLTPKSVWRCHDQRGYNK
jgi:hypothetical protein